MNFFAKNILFLRKKHKYTQAEMPALIGVGRATWSNYENGLTEPDFDKLIGIAKLFNVTIDDILTVDIGANAHFIDNEAMSNNSAKKYPLNTDTDNSMVQEPEAPYETTKKEQVNWLILQGINNIGENVTKIKEKLGI